MVGAAGMGDWEILTGDFGDGAIDISTSGEDSSKSKNTKCIKADFLIPGKGKPVNNQLIISEHGKIVYVGSHKSIPSKYSDVPAQHVPILMPGMWECHSHFMVASPLKPINSENIAMSSPAEAGARNVRALKDTLYAGCTSCVDLGGYAPELQRVIDEGLILGPTLYGTGAAISMTAGHGDVFEYVCELTQGIEDEYNEDKLILGDRIPYGSAYQKLSVNAPGSEVGSNVMLLADGVEECRKAVRVNLRRGARVIKVMTTGGATSRDDNPLYQQFSDEELKVIVEEAGRMGMVCAAHAIGKPGIMAAIRAGFKVIEHSSYADDEVFQAMKKNDVMLVATMTAIKSILDNKDAYPPEMYEKVLRLSEKHIPMYRAAVKAGVKCALGSDLFGGIGTVLSPGLNGKEVPFAVKYGGMTPLDAIEVSGAIISMTAF